MLITFLKFLNPNFEPFLGQKAQPGKIVRLVDGNDVFGLGYVHNLEKEFIGPSDLLQIHHAVGKMTVMAVFDKYCHEEVRR